MATKLQYFQDVSERTVNQLTDKRGNWTSYLDTAARLYKYSFPDQLLIHAQRPDAAAVAPIELWNDQFNRWVRRGSKGIALIDDSGSYPFLKYVFDVSDTEASRYNARPVHLWEMRQEHRESVLAELAKSYEDVGDTLADSFNNIAKQLAREYYNDNATDIQYRAEDSFLEPGTAYDFAGTPLEQRDNGNLEAVFVDTLSKSVAYTLMSRCGLNTSDYFEDEEFQNVTDFNTSDMVYALGTATSDLSQQVLRDVELTIKKYERLHTAERSEQNYDRNPYLHDERGLSPAGHQIIGTAEGTDGTARTLRQNEESVPQRPQDNQLQPPVTDGETVSPLAGGGASGNREVGTGDESLDRTDTDTGQSDRPDGVDGDDEYVESAGGRNGVERVDLQLNPENTDPPETFSQVGKSSIEEAISTSSITMDEVDSILRDGGNRKNSVLRIAAHFAKGKDDNAEFLRREFIHPYREDIPSGKGFDFGGKRISVWFDERGISLGIGKSALGERNAVTISWEQAAARVNELSYGGQYISQDTLDEALNNERFELAGRLWDFYRDDMHHIPDEWNAAHGGYPEDRALIKGQLDNADKRQAITERLEIDVNTWINSNERSWNSPQQLLADMRDSMLPPVIFPDADFRVTSDFKRFISEDEITDEIAQNGSKSDIRLHYLSFFLNSKSDKERTDFIKNQYGHGGGSWRGVDNGWIDHEPGKGLTFKRGGSLTNPEVVVNLKWNEVARRTQRLISDGLYATRADLDYIPNYEKLMLARTINSFYYDLPREEYERPFENELDLYYPDEDVWNEIDAFFGDNERIDGTLSQMKYLFENTSSEDRYYNTRKTGYESLSAYREGTYTLFPGIERLPTPEAAAARRIRKPEPRSESVIDLSEPLSAAPIQAGEQLTLFSLIQEVTLPSVEEQQAVIDQALQAEAAEVKAAISLEQDSIDTLLLNISDENKERIAEQFKTAPRSREAVALFREVYGNSLPIPQPQAMKRLAELAVDGAFRTGVEVINDAITFIHNSETEKRAVIYEQLQMAKEQAPPDAVVMLQVGSFYEMYGKDAEIAVEQLNLEIVYRFSEAGFPERTPMCGFPEWTLDSNIEKLQAAGYTVAVATVGDDGEHSVSIKLFGEKPLVSNVQQLTKSREELNEIAENLLEDYSATNYMTKPNPLRVDVVDLWDKTGTMQINKDIQGADREFVRERLISILNFDAELMEDEDKLPVPFPLTSREAALTGRDDGTVIVFQTRYPVAVPFVIDDINGHELSRVDIRTSENPPVDGQITVYASKQSVLEASRIVGNESFNIMRVRSLREPEQETVQAQQTAQYAVGDTVYLDNKPFSITQISGISGEVQLQDTSLFYPLFRAESKDSFERLLSMDERNSHFYTAESETVIENVANIPEPAIEVIAATESTPTELDFDTVAQMVFERVTANEDYKTALTAARSRSALRYPLTVAIDEAVLALDLATRYYSDDDFSDDLFDFVYRQSWEHRTQPEAVKESEASVDVPTYNVGDTITRDGKQYEINKIDTDYVRLEKFDEKFYHPRIKDYTTLDRRVFERELSEGNIVISGDEPRPRFEVCVTSDAWADPEDAYAIWDNQQEEYYSEDDIVVTFAEKEQADEYLQTLIGGTSEKTEPVAIFDRTPTQIYNLFALAFPRIADGTYQSMRFKDERNRELSLSFDTTNADILNLDISYFNNSPVRSFAPMFQFRMNRENRRLTPIAYANAETGEDYGLLTLPSDSYAETLAAKAYEFFADVNSMGFVQTEAEVFLDADGKPLPAEPKSNLDEFLKERADREADAHFNVQRSMFDIHTPETPEYSELDYVLIDELSDYTKHRIIDFVTEQAHSQAEIAEFMQRTYGNMSYAGRGLITPRLPFATYQTFAWKGNNDGLTVVGINGATTLYSWETVAEHIVTLVNRGEYMKSLAEFNTNYPYTAEHERNVEIQQESATPKINFRITDDHLGEGSAKTKYRANVEAIQIVKALELENRNATPDEQETLSRYVGWGGIPQAFDEKNQDWSKEYAELNALLSPEEFASARASTLNAHYTSPTVIKAMWETVERLGFKSGNVLEPSMGIGNFFGLIPNDMWQSKLYGVELDQITAQIAKQLYPRADVRQAGYEKTDFPDAFFDIAIGNVPFGDYGVVDKRYNKQNFHIHDYFFAKTLDQVRPGGVIAFVTSKYTLDKQDPKVRKYIAQRADLLGAVRLPNNAFLKNAGTETTMDIIFLQKRDRVIDIEPDWVHLGLTADGLTVNRYYLDNPEMVCGTMGLDVRMNNKYGRTDYTACLPTEGADLGEQLKTALSHIQGEYTITELDDLDGVDDHAILADSHVKNFSYALVTPDEPDENGKVYAGKIGEGKVYFRENSLMYPVELPATTLERITGMIGLRECAHKLIELQLNEHSDEEIKAQQVILNDLYDEFTSEYGLINSQANNRAFNADSAYYLLSSLEIIDEDGKLERKADMFTKRTIKQKTIITHVDTASEALAVSIGEKARIDMEYMTELTGKDEEMLFSELRGVIFRDFNGMPDGSFTYRTADDFLSGNVRDKLHKYQQGLSYVKPGHKNYDAISDNVKALEAAQPKDLEASEISVRLGSTWIDPEYVQQFMYGLLNTSWQKQSIYQVKYHEYTGEWRVTSKGKSQYSDIPATVTYGTGRMSAYEIIDDTLNLRDVRVYDYTKDADGKEHRVLNKKETTLAQQKQELIKQAFKDWIWKDPTRRQTLVQHYNETFNSTRPREYDGSHIVFSGISPEITLRPHQLGAIAHILYGGNTLLAHEVGAGKTFEMVGAAMESKRLGLCQKSLFSVPNHLTEQWAAEFLRLYPSANILVATKRDFEMRNRKKLCAKIATGDYDAVIIGHSQLEKIPLSQERMERLINEQIWEIEEGIEELENSNGEYFSIKQLEGTKKKLEARLEKMLDGKNKDSVVTFEQLGVDRLFIDEAHNFKNLFMYTKMRNVAGLSTSEEAKSSDLFAKCRYMDELTGGKGVIFATGTPISNSMTEMYTMQRYLQYDTLEAHNLTHFDAWASTFGETVTSIELAPEGTGYRARTRFAQFHNLPELMCMFKDVADIQTADMLDLPVPQAKFETVVVEPSELQKEMVQELSERAAAVHNREVDSSVDNMLKITTDGRKIGLDQRLINPMLPDFEGSKVNACTDNVFRVWEETKADRLTQLVFCDFSTPNKNGRFNVYDDIKAKLLERGIPESEIAFIHDADTEIRKKELFAKVRQGKVRIMFGSTFKMGAGSNVQDRLVAIHDADCPWRPADLAQRAGRIVRQGNMNPEVKIFRYATNGTFDSYLWQTVENKQKFISQIMSSKSPVRTCDDVDEAALSYAEIKALCAGNPLIAEKMNLDIEVAKLRMIKSEHQSQHYRLEDALLKSFPQDIAAVTERIAGITKDIAAYSAQQEKCVDVQTDLTGGVSVGAKFPGMTIGGVVYTEKEPAANALIEACKSVTDKEEKPIGEYMGFQLSLHLERLSVNEMKLLLRGAMTYQIDLGTDSFGNITRINNALADLPKRLEGAKSNLDNLLEQQEAAKAELEKPFTLEAELAEKEARLALLNADLNIDGSGGMDVVNDPDSRAEIDGAYDEPEERESSSTPNPPIELLNPGATFHYPSEQERRTGTYNKNAKPSLLEGIRNFNGGNQKAPKPQGLPNSPGREKSSDLGI
jgi:N12 class adenine-specific DNA methylase